MLPATLFGCTALQVGFVFGLMNGLGSLAGAAAPLVVGQLTSSAGCTETNSDEPPTAECSKAWKTVFYLSASIWLFGGLQYLVVGGWDPAYRKADASNKRFKDNRRNNDGTDAAGTTTRPLLSTRN